MTFRSVESNCVASLIWLKVTIQTQVLLNYCSCKRVVILHILQLYFSIARISPSAFTDTNDGYFHTQLTLKNIEPSITQVLIPQGTNQK